MIKYKLARFDNLIKTDTDDPEYFAIIPSDLDNTEYQAYLKWLDEGNTPEPADPEPEPVELTPQQKLANAGLTVDELKTLLGLS